MSDLLESRDCIRSPTISLDGVAARDMVCGTVYSSC